MYYFHINSVRSLNILNSTEKLCSTSSLANYSLHLIRIFLYLDLTSCSLKLESKIRLFISIKSYKSDKGEMVSLELFCVEFVLKYEACDLVVDLPTAAGFENEQQ